MLSSAPPRATLHCCGRPSSHPHPIRFLYLHLGLLLSLSPPSRPPQPLFSSLPGNLGAPLRSLGRFAGIVDGDGYLNSTPPQTASVEGNTLPPGKTAAAAASGSAVAGDAPSGEIRVLQVDLGTDLPPVEVDSEELSEILAEELRMAPQGLGGLKPPAAASSTSRFGALNGCTPNSRGASNSAMKQYGAGIFLGDAEEYPQAGKVAGSGDTGPLSAAALAARLVRACGQAVDGYGGAPVGPAPETRGHTDKTEPEPRGQRRGAPQTLPLDAIMPSGRPVFRKIQTVPCTSLSKQAPFSPPYRHTVTALPCPIPHISSHYQSRLSSSAASLPFFPGPFRVGGLGNGVSSRQGGGFALRGVGGAGQALTQLLTHLGRIERKMDASNRRVAEVRRFLFHLLFHVQLASNSLRSANLRTHLRGFDSPKRGSEAALKRLSDASGCTAALSDLLLCARPPIVCHPPQTQLRLEALESAIGRSAAAAAAASASAAAAAADAAKAGARASENASRTSRLRASAGAKGATHSASAVNLRRISSVPSKRPSLLSATAASSSAGVAAGAAAQGKGGGLRSPQGVIGGERQQRSQHRLTWGTKLSEEPAQTSPNGDSAMPRSGDTRRRRSSTSAVAGGAGAGITGRLAEHDDRARLGSEARAAAAAGGRVSPQRSQTDDQRRRMSSSVAASPRAAAAALRSRRTSTSAVMTGEEEEGGGGAGRANNSSSSVAALLLTPPRADRRDSGGGRVRSSSSSRQRRSSTSAVSGSGR